MPTFTRTPVIHTEPDAATLARVLGPGAAIFSCLLVATGVAKLRRPGDTSRALAAFGLPAHRAVGALIGLVEIVVGLAAMFTAMPVALAAQGFLYVSFATWVTLAIARDIPISSCGCLGTDDTPPYWGHVVLDVVAAMMSIAALFTATSPFWQGAPMEVVSRSIIIGVGAFLAWIVIGEGARVRVGYAR